MATRSPDSVHRSVCADAGAAAGALTVAASSMYGAVAVLGEQYDGVSRAGVVLETARNFALAMDMLVGVATIAAAVGICAIGVVAARERLVPRAITGVMPAAVLLLSIAALSKVTTDGWATWIFLGAGFACLMLWLLVAGCWLLVGGNGATPLKNGPRAA